MAKQRRYRTSAGQSVVSDWLGMLAPASGDSFPNLDPHQFRDWWEVMDRRLLRRLDTFFERIAGEGGRAFVSPAPGSLGRAYGSHTSQHYAGESGTDTVRAADIMIEGMPLRRAYEIARDVGFNGIGVYPRWVPSPGLHLDMRPGRTASNPALWGALKDASGANLYVSIEQALNAA